jgi:hypothetical protein
MLALEDGPRLRLLAGAGEPELDAMRLAGSPTRFGRIDMELEPASEGWRLRFERGSGPAPEAVELPAEFSEVTGASSRREAGAVLVDPTAKAWTALRPHA